ncbi:uncharacterized protein V6R79_019254 [Siganus canaliculatus]
MLSGYKAKTSVCLYCIPEQVLMETISQPVMKFMKWIASLIKGKPKDSTVQHVRMKNVKARSISLRTSRREAGSRTGPAGTGQHTALANSTATGRRSFIQLDFENVECDGAVNIDHTL